MTKRQQPTKTDLLRVLNEHKNEKPLHEAYNQKEKASNAFQKFCSTNKTYLRLERAEKDAWHKYYQLEQIRRREMQKIRDAIHLEGVTSRTIQMVKLFIAEDS